MPIIPKLIMYRSVEAFCNGYNSGIANVNREKEDQFRKIFFADLLKNSYVLCGEPGYGKSHLLQLLANDIFEKHEHEFCIVDLKKIKGKFKGFFKKMEVLESFNTKDFVFGKSKGFDLKSKTNQYLLLDALDEVDLEKQPKTINKLIELKKRYSNLLFIISSRANFAKQHEEKLSMFKFQVVIVSKFTIDQSIELLQKLCPTLNEIGSEKTFNLLSDNKLLNNWDQEKKLLHTPRYILMYAELINNLGFQEVKEFSRFQVFERAIEHNLSTQVEKLNNKIKQKSKFELPRIKEILERLALILEIKRTNKITRSELTTIFFETELAHSSQLFYEGLMNRAYLKNYGDSIEFDNTEIQEFLAAKALLHYDSIDQVIFDLAVDPSLNQIYFNWYNTIGFIVESKPKFLRPFINFILNNQDEQYLRIVSFMPQNRIHTEKPLCEYIFKKVYSYFMDKSKFFPVFLPNWLSPFYIHEKHFYLISSSLEKFTSYDDQTIFANAALMIEPLVVLKKIPKEKIEKIKDTLINGADHNLNQFNRDVMQRFSIRSLIFMDCGIEEIRHLSRLYQNSTTIISGYIIDLFSKVDPNHLITIELFLKDLDKGSHYPKKSLVNINSQLGFLNLFKIINEELKVQIHKERFEYYYNKLKVNEIWPDKMFNQKVLENWSDELNNELLKLVVNIVKENRIRNRQFTSSILETLNDKNQNLIFTILDRLDLANIDYPNLYFLGSLITQSNYQKILSEFESSDFDITSKLLRYSNDPEVYQKYYGKIRSRKESRARMIELQNEEEIRYQKSNEILRKRIINNEFTAIPEIIQDPFYKELDSPFLENLKRLVASYITEYEYKVQEIQDLIFTRRISNYFEILFSCVWLVKEMNIDLNHESRSKILPLLLFERYSYKLNYNDIYGIVNSPSAEELNKVVLLYRELYDDRLEIYVVHSFIKFCLVNKVKHCVGDLIKLIEDCNDEVVKFSALKAFTILHEGTSHDKYLVNLFHKLVVENQINGFTLELNKILVNHENKNAIDWLFDNVLNYRVVIKLDPNSNNITRPASNWIGENLPKNLDELSDIKHRDSFLKLLDDSIEVLNRNIEYKQYIVQTIWERIKYYFKKSESTFFSSNIKLLKDRFIKLKENKRSPIIIQNYNFWMKDIEFAYMSELDKESSIRDAIKKYNFVKGKKYLEVFTNLGLFKLVKESIENDLKYWINELGAHKLMSMTVKNRKEDFIQRILVPQFENFLMKRGLRPSDVKIYREIEGIGKLRIDLLVSYGTMGPILIEIKRLVNKELNNLDKMHSYRKSTFLPYMKETNSSNGIYLVLRDTTNRTLKNFKEKVEMLKNVYNEDHNIEVIGINCIAENNEKKHESNSKHY